MEDGAQIHLQILSSVPQTCVASPSVYPAPGVVTKRRRRRLQCRSTDKRSWVHGALRRRRESEAFRPAGGGGMYTGRPGMYYSLFLLVILRTPPGQQLSIWNATPPRSSSILFRPRPSIWVDRPRVVERGMDPVSGYYIPVFKITTCPDFLHDPSRGDSYGRKCIRVW